MNACPNCGAELKFDIASQMLACPFCGAKVDPATYRDFGAAADEDVVSMAAAGTEEGIAQDVINPSRIQYSQSQYPGQGGGYAAQTPAHLGPSGNLGPSGGEVPQNTAAPAGVGFAGVGSGFSGGFASQGSSFAGVGMSSAGSFASPAGTGALGGGFAAQGGSSMAAPVTGAAPMAAAIPMATPVTGAVPMAAAIPMAAPVTGAAPMATAIPMATPVTGAAIPMAAPIAGGMPLAGAVPAAGQPVMASAVQQPVTPPQPEYDPSFDPTANAEELQVIAYSCPQCGGSIYSTEESVNGFCSFCGSNITLQSRMARMKYPKYVLPFRVNKHACKQYYLNYVKKAFFAPKELKNPEYLERFRGIYMPYWGYDVMLYGNVMLNGTISYRRGDYVFTEHYNCSGLVDAFYKGLSYDASSTFDDHFSEQIAPFDAHAMIDFNPAYLSGFYADLQDVSYHVYEDDAIRFGQKRIMESIKESQVFPRISFADSQESRIRPTVDARHDGVYTTFFPVWFLSYRNKDRIAYAVVNGQTGKLVSDLPVDKKKFILSALIMAIPIFALLMMAPVMKPSSLVILAEIFSLIAVLLLMNTIKKVAIRDGRLDDRGYLSKYDRANYDVAKAEAAKKSKKDKSLGIGGVAVIVFIVLFSAAGPILSAVAMIVQILYSMGSFGKALVPLAIAIVLVVVNASGTKRVKAVAEKGAGALLLGVWLIFAASLYGGIVILADPVSNLPYYIGVILLFAGTLVAQLMALEQYNMLTTRPLPQLNRKGGDDSAQD